MITEQKIRDFCEANECGVIMKVNKPKAKKNRAIAFIEFERKTDADRFVKKFGKKETGELAGESFLAEISRAKPARFPRGRSGPGNYGRGFRGRGNWGGRGGGFFQGFNPAMAYGMHYNPYHAYGAAAGYGRYSGAYNYGGFQYGKGANRGRGGRNNYKPY